MLRKVFLVTLVFGCVRLHAYEPPKLWRVDDWYYSTTEKERILMYYSIRNTLLFVGALFTHMPDESLSLLHRATLSKLEALTKPEPYEFHVFVEQALRDRDVFNSARDKHVLYFIFSALEIYTRPKQRR